MPKNESAQYVDSNTIVDMLPENAKKYYQPGSVNFDIKSILHHHSGAQNILRKIALGITFPVNIWRVKLIQDGEVGLATYKEEFVFKGPGYQFVLDPRNSIQEVVDIGSIHITHGPKKIIRINQGSLGFAVNTSNGAPIILGAGTHYFEDPCIKIKGNISLGHNNKDKKEVGRDNNVSAFLTESMTFVRVDQGSCGISYGGDGQIELLDPGLHLIEWPCSFHSHVSVKQEILGLKPGTYLTQDSVEFNIKASLAYKLVDPKKAFSHSITDKKDIDDTLIAKGTSTLIQAMRQVNAREAGTFNLSAQKKGASEIDLKVKPEQLIAINFAEVKDIARKIFIDNLQSEFGDQYGFEIESLDFSEFEYSERYKKILTETIDNTIKKAKISAEEEMLPAQIRIATITAEKDKNIAIIKVEADAQVQLKKAEAEAAAKKIKAEMDAEVVKIGAQARAQATREEAGAEAFKIATLGAAERERIESIAQGQKVLAQTLEETKYGAQLALADVYQKSIEGLAKGANVTVTAEQLSLDGMLRNILTGYKNAISNPTDSRMKNSVGQSIEVDQKTFDEHSRVSKSNRA